MLVISQRDGLWVSDAQDPAPKILPMSMCNYASVSPDGHWAAATSRRGIGMKVWELPSGREVLTLTNAFPTVGFTRNGRWLVLASEDIFWCLEVGTWVPVAEASPERSLVWAQALSADSQWVALEEGRPGRLVFCELPMLRPLFTLDSAGGFPMCFSPDNALLLTRSLRGDFGLWNLRRIREKLTPLGLAW